MTEEWTEPPVDPRQSRQRRLAWFLRVALIVVLALAVVGLVLPGDAGRTVGVAMTITLGATPVVRLFWLLVRWVHKRDYRFAATLGGLLAVLATATVIAAT
jgi:hypothetical protein